MERAAPSSTARQTDYEQVNSALVTPLAEPDPSLDMQNSSASDVSWPRLEAKLNDIRRIVYSLLRKDHSGLTNQLKGQLEFHISQRFRRRYQRLTSSLALSLILITCTAVSLLWFLSQARTQVRERSQQLAHLTTAPEIQIQSPPSALLTPPRPDLTRKVQTLEQTRDQLSTELNRLNSENTLLKDRLAELDRLYEVASEHIQGLEIFSDNQTSEITHLKQRLHQLQSRQLVSFNPPAK